MTKSSEQMKPLPVGILFAILLLLAFTPCSPNEDMARTGRPPTEPTPPSELLIKSGKRVHRFEVEVAKTTAEQQRGLMFRNNLPANGGMLFVFQREWQASVWMKNTLIPLDILFIAADGRIVRIVRDAMPRSKTIISADRPVKGVLEINGGLTRKLRIETGDRVHMPVFFPQTGASGRREFPSQGGAR